MDRWLIKISLVGQSRGKALTSSRESKKEIALKASIS